MKKILAFILSISMVLCSFSVTAFADEGIELPIDVLEDEKHYFAVGADEELQISAFVGETPIDEAFEKNEDEDFIFTEEEFTLTFVTENPDCYFKGIMDYSPEGEDGEWVRHWFRDGSHGVTVDEKGLHYVVTAEMQQKDHFFMPVAWESLFDGEMLVYDLPEGWSFLNNGEKPEPIFSEDYGMAVSYGEGINITFLDGEGSPCCPYAVKCDADYGPDGNPSISHMICANPESEFYDEDFANTGIASFDVKGLSADIRPFFTKGEFDFATFDPGDNNVVEVEINHLGSVDFEYLQEYSKYVVNDTRIKFAVDKNKDTFAFVLTPESDRVNWINTQNAGYDRQSAIDEGVLTVITDTETGKKYQKIVIPVEEYGGFAAIDFEHSEYDYRGFNIGFDMSDFTAQIAMPGKEFSDWFGGCEFPWEYKDSDKICIKLLVNDPQRSIFAIEKNDNKTGKQYVLQPEYVDGDEPYYYFEIPAADFESDLYFELREERMPLAGEIAFDFNGNGIMVYNEAEGPDHPIEPWDDENHCRRIFTYTEGFNICAAEWDNPQAPKGIFAAEVRLNNGDHYLFCSSDTYAQEHDMTYLEGLGSGKLSLPGELLKGEGANVRIWFDTGAYKCDTMSSGIGQRMIEFGVADGDGELVFIGAPEDIYDKASKDEGRWQKVLIDEDRRSCEILIATGKAYAYEANGQYKELEPGQTSISLELDPHSNYTNVNVFFYRIPKYWVDWTEGEIEVRAGSIEGPVLDRCCDLDMADENTVIAIVPGKDVVFRGLNIQENDGVITSVPVSELTKTAYDGGFYYTYKVPYNTENGAPTRIWAFSGQPLCGEFKLSNNDNDGIIKLDGVEIPSWIGDTQQIYHYEGDELKLSYESKNPEVFTKPYAIRVNGLCMDDIYYVGDEIPEGEITVNTEGRGVWLNIWWNEDQFIFDETRPNENEREVYISTGGMEYENAEMFIPELDEIAVNKVIFGDAVKYIIPAEYGMLAFTATSYNCSFRGIHINGNDISTEAPYPMSYEFKDIDMSDNINIHIDMFHDDEEAEVIGTISDYGVNIGADFALRFRALFMPRRAENMFMVVSRGEEVLSRIPAEGRGNDEFEFTFTNIGAQHMTDRYKLELIYFDGEKDVVLKTKEASIQGYINDVYMFNNGEDGNHDEKLNQVLRDMMEYGAWAQRYAGYKTDDLVDALEWEDEITLTEFIPLTENETVKDRTETTEPGTRINGIALRLGEAVSLVPVVKTSNAEGLLIKATVLDNVRYYEVEQYGKDGTYKVIIDPVSFSGLDAVYTLELVRNGNVLQTVTYSVNSYVHSMQNDETELGHLVRAIYCLGISSKAYYEE